jgi:DNA-directed RNA polymerase sigma subunit (sigma70/sigma32)
MKTATRPSDTVPDNRPKYNQTRAIRTYSEVAEILGCSESNVQQIEATALKKMRRSRSLRALFVYLNQ